MNQQLLAIKFISIFYFKVHQCTNFLLACKPTFAKPQKCDLLQSMKIDTYEINVSSSWFIESLFRYLLLFKHLICLHLQYLVLSTTQNKYFLKTLCGPLNEETILVCNFVSQKLLWIGMEIHTETEIKGR